MSSSDTDRPNDRTGDGWRVSVNGREVGRTDRAVTLDDAHRVADAHLGPHRGMDWDARARTVRYWTARDREARGDARRREARQR